jgi:hypothetical protein
LVEVPLNGVKANSQIHNYRVKAGGIHSKKKDPINEYIGKKWS